MTKRNVSVLPLLLAPVLVTLTSPGMVQAELPERKSPLADAPAVRHRVELRRLRFEIGPGVTSTIGQDFYHAIMVGGKASFFLSDWLAISGVAGHNLMKDFKTSFHGKLEGALKTQAGDDRAPSYEEAKQG